MYGKGKVIIASGLVGEDVILHGRSPGELNGPTGRRTVGVMSYFGLFSRNITMTLD